ncbi:permease-like cell division protein FtsX [Sphaerisporangium sp. B11E5]|uniref:permease-like cell division protein FtsX n=1 Tax=Sphaerisporangium sp. B11E5 TaxID=3153563 RepID=UPI00325C95E0
MLLDRHMVLVTRHASMLTGGKKDRKSGRMNAPTESSDAEELSFGGEPDRVSWLRSWAFAHRRSLLAGAAVLVLSGLFVAGGWHLRDLSRRPLPPPDGPWPQQNGFTVGLCGQPAAACTPAENEAAENPSGVLAALQAISGVANARLACAPSCLQKTRNVWRSRVLQGTIYDSDYPGTSFMPAYFDMTLDRWDDRARIAEQAMSIPGVWYVFPKAPDFWEGKADVAIDLCSHPAGLLCTGVHDRSVTETQKQAIVDRLWNIDGVEKIYYENHAHRTKIQEHYEIPDLPGHKGIGTVRLVSLEEMTESFYVKLTDRRAIEVIGESIKDMPGVHYVRRIGPA